MPHGNKKSRVNNKKQKGSRGGQQSRHGATSTNDTTAAPSRATSQPPHRADFAAWEQPDDVPTSQKESSAFTTIYDRYKQATERFRDTLLSLVPPDVLQGIYGVNAFAEAADYLAENNIVVSSQLLDDLKIAIRLRKRYSVSIQGGGDAGHAHFLLVLNYCWTVLKPIRRQASPTPVTEGNNEAKGARENVNRFACLSLEDAEETEMDEEDDLPTPGTVPRPSVPKECERLSLDDLIRGPDRLHAYAFLLSLDKMMNDISIRYKWLKSAWRGWQMRGLPRDGIIEKVVEAAVQVNFCIQQVQHLEQVLIANFPHLNTFYRVAVNQYFPVLAKELTDSIHQHSSRSQDFDEKDAVAFLGDILECSFRHPSDPLRNPNDIISGFCTKWKIPREAIDWEKIYFLGRVEAPVGQERATNPELFQSAHSMELQSHEWFKDLPFIGGGQGRPFSTTFKLLQWLSAVVKKSSYLELKRGALGRQWDEGKMKAAKIAGDLDEFLMGDVLPTLLFLCSDGLLATKLPRENELLTFFTVIKTFVNAPEKPVTWALAFSVQSLLTSVFEMQGENDIHTLSDTARGCWDAYMGQLQCMDRKDTVQAKHWNTKLNSMYTLRWLVEPLAKVTPEQEERAIWNPLCAGMFLSYLCFFSNLDYGSAMVDSYAQLRMVLHLYNGFLQVGKFVPGEVELLDWLNDIFSSCKAIWEGQKPSKGEMVKRWWITNGTTIDAAQKIAENVRTGVQMGTFVEYNPLIVGGRRRMTRISPKDLSTSYRRICLRDFSDVVEKYHNAHQRREGSGEPMDELAVRIKDTFHAMDSEKVLLATNLTSLGCILNDFVEGLFDDLEWTPETLSSVHPSQIREVRMTLFAQHILGALDFDNESQGIVQTVARTGRFMKEFFRRVRRGQVLFFTPTEPGNNYHKVASTPYHV